MRRRRVLFSILMIVAGMAELSAHDADSLVSYGDSLRSLYRFEESIEAYTKALEALPDSAMTAKDSLFALSIEDRMLLSENGRSMAAYVDAPVVVAKHRFSLSDFFLYYPLPDKSWRPLPNQLDSTAAGIFPYAMYVPEGVERIYYSGEDAGGIRNIYKTEQQDSLWTIPALLNEQMTSAGNEVFPMLSPDGKSMYFSSEGLYGVGGYDLYVSSWNEEQQDWSAPVNMGFPYSSPANDYLFVNTDDGKYSVFASDRDCAPDSVWVYVLEFDNMPVRKALETPGELLELSRLVPVENMDRMGGTADVNADIPENVDTRRYMAQMSRVQALRDSIARYDELMDAERMRLAMSNDPDERAALTTEILRRESYVPHLQDSLDKAVAHLQKIEMEFLFSGVVIDPDKLLAEADKEVVGESTGYAFSRNSMGEELKLDMMQPQVQFDYSFKVLEQGQFAEDQTIPDGIVYQIQMFSSGQKAGLKSLKGLSPVYEHRTAGGRYVYRVGLFRTYKDVLSHLNTVKKLGFRTAFITAFSDGSEISVAKARTLETQQKAVTTFHQVHIVPEDGELDPVLAEGIVRQSGGKDMARTELEDGTIVFMVGPFSDKAAAEALADFVKAMGIADVKVKNTEI